MNQIDALLDYEDKRENAKLVLATVQAEWGNEEKKTELLAELRRATKAALDAFDVYYQEKLKEVSG